MSACGVAQAAGRSPGVVAVLDSVRRRQRLRAKEVQNELEPNKAIESDGEDAAPHGGRWATCHATVR